MAAMLLLSLGLLLLKANALLFFALFLAFLARLQLVRVARFRDGLLGLGAASSIGCDLFRDDAPHSFVADLLPAYLLDLQLVGESQIVPMVMNEFRHLWVGRLRAERMLRHLVASGVIFGFD